MIALNNSRPQARGAIFSIKNKSVTVNKSAVFNHNQSQIEKPKTAAGVRKIPIPDTIIDALKEYRKKLTVIDNITPHMFRYTCATILYNAGVDVKSAQRFLGHADINMTLKIYTIFQPKKEQEA